MTRSDDTGKLVLRLALGILILLHGINKLSTGVGGIEGMITAHGLPGALAYLVYIGEIVAPVLMIVGIYTRPAAWITVINMLVAIWLVHLKDMDNPWELVKMLREAMKMRQRAFKGDATMVFKILDRMIMDAEDEIHQEGYRKI